MKAVLQLGLGAEHLIGKTQKAFGVLGNRTGLLFRQEALLVFNDILFGDNERYVPDLRRDRSAQGIFKQTSRQAVIGLRGTDTPVGGQQGVGGADDGMDGAEAGGIPLPFLQT